MRTKTLLLTAVLGVAGIAATTAQAQSVYSQNAVGYVNLSLGAQFSMIANPLNNGSNDLNTILINVPSGTQIFTFDPTQQAYIATTFRGGTWHNSDSVLAPGSGAFISLAAPAQITFVGNVPQGNLANVVPPGFSIQSIPMPVSVSLTNSIVGLVASGIHNNDVVYSFSNATQGYTVHTYRAGAFHNTDYTPAVGESFFYFNSTTAAFNWSVSFSVN